MKKLPTTIGTKFKVKTNPDLGVLTIVKCDYLIDEFGDKTDTKAVKYTDALGNTRGCTPVNLFTEQHFELA